MNKSPHRKLGLQTNIINYVIQQSNKETRLLDSPLFSLEGTPVRSTLGDYLPQDSLNKYNPMMRLQYSPDSICSKSGFLQNNFEESFLLEDSPENVSDRRFMKRQIEQTTKSQLSDRCQAESIPTCSLFKISDDTGGLKAGLLSISSYVFKIDYEPIDAQKIKDLYGIDKRVLTEDRLIRKMIKYFKDYPFELFYFYNKVIKKWNVTVLRKFLIEKGINYSGEHVHKLEMRIAKCFQTMKSDQLMNMIFFSREVEDIFILNLEGQPHCQTLDMTSKSFWQTFSGYFSSNQYFRKYQLGGHFDIFISSLL